MSEINLEDFVEIPGFSRYMMNKDGAVYSKIRDAIVPGSFNPAGYLNHRLIRDIGGTLTIGRHRLMCITFKPIPDHRGLCVNHINGVKGDDRIENLEWVTFTGNLEHAGLNGLTEKCCPLSVRDMATGLVYEFPSVKKCSTFYGMSKDAVLHRLKFPKDRVFPEGRQYCKGIAISEWIDPRPGGGGYGTSRKVSLKHVGSGKVIHFQTALAACEFLNISPASFSVFMKNFNQPVFPDWYIAKYSDNSDPWREVVNHIGEYSDQVGTKPVTVTTINGDSVSYYSSTECAKAHGLTSTVLHYRLKYASDKFFSGYNFKYMER